MSLILAIDPGPEQSAWVVYQSITGKVLWAKEPNDVVLARLADWVWYRDLVIEMVASYGMPVGAEVFDTCVWIGRFTQAWLGEPGRTVRTLTRKDVKLHLCGRTAGVNDAVIRQALIDRFGPGKDKAIGTKANPGPLCGLKADGWAALAVAVTDADRQAGLS